MIDRRGDKGFTLLEVLIASTLLVLVCGTLYSTFFGLMKARETAATGMESRRELRATLDMLRKELSAAYYLKNNKRLHFIVEDRDSFGKPASTLNLTTITAPVVGLAASDQLEVAYTPVEKGGQIDLIRQAKELHVSTAPLSYPQMEKIEGFLVECYDGGKWVKNWDTELYGKLPKAVRITVMMQEGPKTVGFSTVAVPRISGS